MDQETRPISTSFLTTISGIAILMVVIVHLRVFYYAEAYMQGNFGFVQFIQLNRIDRFIELFIRYPVPLFVFVWGFKFSYYFHRRRGHGTQYNWKNYFISLANQLLIPYFLWSMVYLLAGFVINAIQAAVGAGTPEVFFTRERLVGVLTGLGNFAYQLWFLPMLMFAGVSVISIHYIFKKSWILYIIYVIYYLGIFLFPSVIIKFSPINLWLYYFMNLELGLYFGEKYFKENCIPKLWPVIVAWVVIAALRFSNQNQQLDTFLDTLMLIITPVVWYYVVGMLSRPGHKGILVTLGRYSWAIYLLHTPVLNNFIHFVSQKLGLISPWYDIPKTAIILAICIMVSRLLYAIQFKVSQTYSKQLKKSTVGRIVMDVGNHFI